MLRSLISVLAFAAFAVAASGCDNPYGPSCNFDRSEWLNAKGDYDEAKPIADSLVHCDDILYGKTRAEVRALLGEKDTNGVRDGKIDGWKYNVGVPGIRSDYPGLQVHFDDKGRVEEVRIPGFEER